MPMFCRLPNPDWPVSVKEVFVSIQGETPFGCGGCAHAEWVGRETNSSPPKIYFDVAICLAGIPIMNGEPQKYCTAFRRIGSGAKPLNSVPLVNSGAAEILLQRPAVK